MIEFLPGSFYRETWDREIAFENWVNEVDPIIDQYVAADLISRCGTMETDIYNLQNSKQDKFSGNTLQYVRGDGSLASFPSIPAAQVNSDWEAVSGVAQIINKPKKVFAFKATVSSGNAVFQLTKNGLSTGDAFFSSGPDLDSMQLTAEEGSAPHCFGTPVLSNSNKTLTIPVSKSSGINVALLGLTLLGAPAAANGSPVRLMIAGA